MSDPERCDPELFRHGKVICHFHAPSKPTEAWVRLVAIASGQRVDWSYCGGYAGVRFIGDEARVRAAIELLRPLLVAERFRLYEKGEG
jgi:hypothetical protein